MPSFHQKCIRTSRRQGAMQAEGTDPTTIEQCLLKYYGQHVRSLQLVWRGYSNIYKASLDGGRFFAVLLKRRNKELADILAENEILSALASKPAASIIFPQLVNPLATQVLPKIDDRYVSVFEWVDHLPFDGRDKSRRSAFRAYHNLQRILDTISPPAGLKRLALCRDVLDAKAFDFVRFLPRVSDQEWAVLYRSSVESLQAGVQMMLDDYQALKTHISELTPTIIHYDPSPQNIGVSCENGRAFIMDFDQCKVGFWEYDVPWLVWSFASHGLNLSERSDRTALLRRVRSYLEELRAEGLPSDGLLFRFCLLCRFCLTLHGRLEDTFDRGLDNLRFMDTKILGIRLLIEHYDDFR